MTEKRRRSYAKGAFSRAEKGFEQFIHDSESNGNTDDADNFFGDVERAWRNVETKHEEYIASLEEGAELGEEEIWLEEIQDRYFGMRRRYVKFKYDCNARSKCESLEKARATEHDIYLKFCMKNCFLQKTHTR